MGATGQLRCYMNWMALESFPADSKFWALVEGRRDSFEAQLAAVKASGFSGVQFAERPSKEQLALCRRLHMGVAGSGRVNEPRDADAFAEQMARDEIPCATVHAGWGLENDADARRLIEGILQASQRWKTALYIETHRATICQDLWRTVQFVERFPEMRFNGDFSHWYTGQEMVYGGFDRKFAFIKPVLERVRFLHGRIANPGCIQVPIPAQVQAQAGAPYVDHFRELWTACFRGFLKDTTASDVICFAPELLAPDIYYARAIDGVEESDRWEQSLLLKEMAERCFACAQSW